MKSIVVAILVCICASAAPAQERPRAFAGAQIIPISGPPIPNGVLVVHRGKIVTVGPAGSTIPADAERVEVSARSFDL